ncbi:MAG: hypothetical protein ACI3ZQ_02720 [Candidatus Cryptobacteroides sp.]
MKKFLGKDGLTQTSANHIANVAKEMYESLEAKVDSIRLISRDYTLALNGQQYRLENESSKEEFLAISASLKEIASLKSLIAWLREGIKAKEELCTYTAECKWLDEQIKAGHEELKEPEAGETVSFESILAEEPIDRQARYYALEARCATLGKYIHPDGHLSSARKDFYDKQKNPTAISGSGQDAEINTYSSLFTSEEVDEEFFVLQKEYRAVQAEFNSLKSELENKLVDERRKRLNQLSDARKQWNIKRDAALLERNSEIKALKIIIPDFLKEIYQRVAAVANTK